MGRGGGEGGGGGVSKQFLIDLTHGQKHSMLTGNYPYFIHSKPKWTNSILPSR